VAEGHRRTCVVLVLLLALAGLSEGGALLALQPVLQSGFEVAGTSSPWMRLLSRVGLPAEHALAAGLVLFALMGLGTAALHYVTDVMLVRLMVNVEARCREDISTALMESRWSSFLFLRLGEVGDTIIMDGTQIARGLSLLIQAFGSGLTVLGLLASSMLVSPTMTAYTLLFAAIGYGMFRWVTSRAQRNAEQQKGILTNISAMICDIFNNLKFFRSTGNSAAAARSALGAFTAYKKAYFRGSWYSIVMKLGVECAGVIGVLIFLCATIAFKLNDMASTLVFLAIFYRIIPRMLTLQQSLHNAEMCLPWHRSWHKRLTELRAISEKSSGTRAPSLDLGLRLEGLRYRYPHTERDALRGISLEVARNEFLALVGRSGSGKSTLVDIITGLLCPDAGAVSLDNVPLRDIDQEAWRQRIGLVLQESPVFHGTILENITWHEAEPDREFAIHVLDQVGALEFVQQMPGGLDARIGEKGGTLSGGQRQRLALARALYRRPWLLILDEPTSALDNASEEQILETLQAIKGSCAILLISHRLAPVMIADRVAVFEDGAMVEQGTWNELLSRPGSALSQLAKQGAQATG
jgi:ABC-type multidrug transport system fused ATPase/permease subunit